MTVTPRYDAVADFYAEGWSDELGGPVNLGLFELLGEVDGRSVLEIACGQGHVTRGLARRGAVMTGVELSTGMITRAIDAESAEPLGIHYEHGDVGDPDILAGRTFDAVVCRFALGDIDDLPAALSTVRRVLAPGGVFVVAMLHPCFAGGTGVSGSWPTDKTYQDEGWWRADGERSTLRRQVGANHRTLSTYLNTLREHGLILDRIAEPAPDAEWAATRADAARLPVFLIVRCVAG